MFDWLFEGYLTVHILLAVVVVVLLAVWWRTRQRLWLAAVLAGVVLAGLYGLLDVLVETDREQITARVKAITDGVDAGAKKMQERKRAGNFKNLEPDLDGVFAHISDDFSLGTTDKRGLRKAVEQHMPTFDLRELKIWDIEQVEVRPSDQVSDEDAGLHGLTQADLKRYPQVGTVQFKVKAEGNWPGSGGDFYLVRAAFVTDSDGQWRMKSFRVYNPAFDTKSPLQLPF